MPVTYCKSEGTWSLLLREVCPLRAGDISSLVLQPAVMSTGATRLWLNAKVGELRRKSPSAIGEK
jgi:hypothetical protein